MSFTSVYFSLKLLLFYFIVTINLLFYFIIMIYLSSLISLLWNYYYWPGFFCQRISLFLQNYSNSVEMFEYEIKQVTHSLKKILTCRTINEQWLENIRKKIFSSKLILISVFSWEHNCFNENLQRGHWDPSVESRKTNKNVDLGLVVIKVDWFTRFERGRTWFWNERKY